ncbi:transcriptional regulator, AbrB family [Candidatus Planktophila versatilis]|uniref:AbrB/MazE/SpoVT family DNA-binding domain-containing protein n=1 Tax=Candidatus Planktophila versatilis TaxID=1884905 RepID=UPI000BAC69ED|nr:AbrB/MazE/SpoVT family DNA-binding domain-containing protein [Candidatus Planktophila versatilis]ASY18374.1 transcriptional regulator, AbrB family [Candidatus Planktophila versatilis]
MITTPSEKGLAGLKKKGRINSKNQVTIPADILRVSGLQAGDDVEFAITSEGVIAITALDKGPRKQHKIMALAGDMTEYYDGFDLAAERQSYSRQRP